MARTQIWINRDVIAANKGIPHRANWSAVLSALVDGSTRAAKGYAAHIDGPCEIVYDPDGEKGPSVYIVTEAEVSLSEYPPEPRTA